jgi:thiosulfate dehydrogenase [quinone] large subunit
MPKTLLNAAFVLRILIGWHFLHEGITKILQPGWTSQPYLLDSKGPFAEFYFWIAHHSSLLQIADVVNIILLASIGLLLILGLLEKPAAVGAMILLSFYYLSHPPFPGISYAVPPEGNYLFVDKNLVELAAAWLLYQLPTGSYLGLNRFVQALKQPNP